MLWASVKAVTVLASIQRIADQQHQREHEEQMIDTGEDVIDAQPKIGPRHLKPGLHSRHDEAGRLWCQPRDLRRPVTVPDARQGVGHGRTQAIDRNDLTLQTRSGRWRPTVPERHHLRSTAPAPSLPCRIRASAHRVPSRISPSAGTFQTTENSFGAVSRMSR